MNSLKKCIFLIFLVYSPFIYSIPDYASFASRSSCDFCDMEFTAYIDALYWHVCAGDANRNNDPGDLIHFKPEHNWGWRISGIAYWNSLDFGFRYTYYSDKTKDTINSNGYDTFYKIFDLEVGKPWCFCKGLTLRPFFGGKFANIDIEYFLEDDESTDACLNHNSCGLYLGLGARGQLCSFYICDREILTAIITRFSTGLIDADFKRVIVELDDESNRRNDECFFVPYHEVYLGLEFRMCDHCGMDGFFQLGYEAQYLGWRANDSQNGNIHLGLGGLVLRFGFQF